MTVSVPVLISLALLVAEPRTFEDCEAKVAAQPAALASYECIADLPRHNNQWDEAVRRLEAILAREPKNHLARLALGALEASRAKDRAEPLLVAAAEGLAAEGRRVESIRSRLTLSVFLQIRGRDDDSEAQLAQAAAMADALGDKILDARVWNVQGRQASRRGDYSRAWQLFKRSEAALFPDGPAGLRSFCLSMLGFLSGQMGRPGDALRYYRQEVEILRRTGDRWSEARALLNLATQTGHLWERGEAELEQAMAAAQAALDAATAANARDVVGWAHALLAELANGADAVDHFERALAALRRGLSSGETRRLVAHTAGCASCAEDWRILAELATDEPRARPRSAIRYAAMAAAAVLVVVGAYALLRPKPQPIYRDGRDGRDGPGAPGVVRSLVPDGTILPRANLLLRWSPGPTGARYSVEVAGDDLAVVYRAAGQEAPELRVPPAALEHIPPRGKLLWRVELTLPDGRRLSSPTFVSVVE